MIAKLGRFALVGGIGFVADAFLFAIVYYGGQWPIMQARILSFIFAATVTWLGNRVFTFADQRATGKFLQWVKFMGCATISALPNFIVFKLATYALGNEGVSAMLALVFGVMAGMVSNFLFSHLWVFRSRNTHGKAIR